MLLTILRGIYIGLKISAKCHNCGESNELNIEPIPANTICEFTFVCSNCGALNNLLFDPNNLDPENQEWLCIPPKGFEWVLPSGKITPIIGDPIYVSAFGEYLSRKTYMERYKLDPEIAYQYMRRRRSEQIGSKITNKPSQSVVAQALPDLTNIKKIEVLCENCGNMCELNI
jgi:hypothetical protein